MKAFDPEDWTDRFRDGLLSVRDAVWARDHRTPQEERTAIRKVAAHPAFANVGPVADPIDRGKSITTTVTKTVTWLTEELPPTVRTSAGDPADKAVLMWAHTLRDGSRPAELASTFSGLFRLRSGVADRTTLAARIRAVMWLGGNRPLGGAAPGIEKIYYAVLAALTATADTTVPTLAEPIFEYEWQRLCVVKPRDQRQLCTLLAFLAPAPLPLALLAAGWEALPSPLRRTVRDPTALAELATGLAARGLVAADLNAVTCGTETQTRIRQHLSRRHHQTACTFAVRFLRAALPPDTHFHGSWGGWRPALPHVDSATTHAERLGVRLEDAAHILDRLAVYHREAETDPTTATEVSERAIRLANQAGRPNPQEYAIYLGNYAMALRSARRLSEAIEVMDRSLAVTAQSLGAEHEEHAGSLSIKGNMLEAAKRFEEAAAAHREALAIIKRVAAVRPEHAVIGTLVEILNDYAAFLLRDNPVAPPDAVNQARILLEQALTHVDRGEYGWKQIAGNYARVLQRTGKIDDTERIFRDLVEYCAQAFGDPSYELSVALRDLAEILQETGNPEYEAVNLRAHEVDDAVGADAPVDPDDPMAT